MLHELPATPSTVRWGYFSASLAPIKSGDLIRAEAVTHHAGDAPDLLMDEQVRAINQMVDGRQGIHCCMPRTIFPPKCEELWTMS
jgi:hypothetical protein